MQPVGGAMEGAEPIGGRRGVTGMHQCRGKRAGEQRGDCPARQVHMLGGNSTQGSGKQCRQHEPREPIMSECFVWRSTVHRMPSEKISPGARSLICAASSTSHATPEISAAAKLHHAMRMSRARKAAPAPPI